MKRFVSFIKLLIGVATLLNLILDILDKINLI